MLCFSKKFTWSGESLDFKLFLSMTERSDSGLTSTDLPTNGLVFLVKPAPNEPSRLIIRFWYGYSLRGDLNGEAIPPIKLLLVRLTLLRGETYSDILWFFSISFSSWASTNYENTLLSSFLTARLCMEISLCCVFSSLIIRLRSTFLRSTPASTSLNSSSRILFCSLWPR